MAYSIYFGRSYSKDESPLTFASFDDFVKSLDSKQVNQRETMEHKTPLILAIEARNYHAVKVLLNRGANIKAIAFDPIFKDSFDVWGALFNFQYSGKIIKFKELYNIAKIIIILKKFGSKINIHREYYDPVFSFAIGSISIKKVFELTNRSRILLRVIEIYVNDISVTNFRIAQFLTKYFY